MGTRADFYVGRGLNAEWIGSIAWDGQEIPENVRKAKVRATYRRNVARFFAERDDATLPADGWPWPWDTSKTTDCAYAFDDGQVWEMHSDDVWVKAARRMTGEDKAPKTAMPCEWPNMSDRKNVQLSGNKSGLIVITSAGVK